MVLNFNVFVCVLLVITMEVNLFAQNLSIKENWFCLRNFFSVNAGVSINFPGT